MRANALHPECARCGQILRKRTSDQQRQRIGRLGERTPAPFKIGFCLAYLPLSLRDIQAAVLRSRMHAASNFERTAPVQKRCLCQL